MSDRHGSASLWMLAGLVLLIGAAGLTWWLTRAADRALDARPVGAANAAGDAAAVDPPAAAPEAPELAAPTPAPALPSPLQMPAPIEGSWAPDPQPGLLQLIRSQGDPEGLVDARRAEQVALHVNRGETASPFVGRGAFEVTWLGDLQVPLRDRYQFRVAGKGAVVVTVRDKVVFEEALEGGEWIESKPMRLKKGANPLSVVFAGNALGESTLRLWWKSSETPWEPVHGDVVTHDAAHPRLQKASSLRRGRQLFAELRCVQCHGSRDAELMRRIREGRGMVEAQHGGPSLAAAGERLLNERWTAAWLLNPRFRGPQQHGPAAHVRSAVRMPKMLIGRESPYGGDGAALQEAADIAAFLVSLRSVDAIAGDEAGDQAGARVDEGRHLFERTGCLACHVHPGAATADLELPGRLALDHVRAKWRPDALAAFLNNPRAHDPASRMPAFRFEEGETAALAEFLVSAGEREVSPGPETVGDPERGRELVVTRSCVACHDMGDSVSGQSPEAPAMEELVDMGGGCFAPIPDVGAVPDYDLTPDERTDLAAFLGGAQASLGRHVAVEYATRSISALRCTQCHAYGSGQVPWSAVHRALPLDEEQMENGGSAQSPPLLTWVGGKLRGPWLKSFLLGEVEDSPRPWLDIRMPAFPVRGEDLARGLAATHGYSLADSAPDDAGVLAGQGLQLVGNSGGFNCVTCHALDEQPATQVFETQGINFNRVHERLRPDYYQRWMADPSRIDPESRMPTYSQDGSKTALTDVLGGKADQQFEAIWQFLRSVR